MGFSLRSVALLVVTLDGVMTSSERVLHEAPVLPCAWRKVEHFVSNEHPVSVQFALKQPHLDTLKAIASSVSDPRSDKYGQFLSKDELHSLTIPDSARVLAVETWLRQAGVRFNRLPGATTIEATLSVESASRLFDAQFHHAINDATKQVIVRAGDYWLPAKVHEAVAAVYGLHGIPAPPREALRSAASEPAVTPAVIRSTYGISGVTVPPSATEQINRQAVAEFQGQTTNATDLVDFFKKFDSSAPAADDKVWKFIGNNGKGSEGVEAGLDIEYIMGVAPGVQSEFWYWAGNDFCADLKNWTDTILSDSNAPLVHSVSYGYQGPLDQLGCSDAAVADVDANFVKLAATGKTIIFASGDSGSGYTPSCGQNAYDNNTVVTGIGAQKISVMSAAQCCAAASQAGFPAWTYTPPPKVDAAACSPQAGEAFKGVAVAHGPVQNEGECCSIASSGQYPGVKGFTYLSNSSICTLFGLIEGKQSDKTAMSSTVTPPPTGTCTAFQSFTSKASASGKVSGGDAVQPVPPKLYPSWPASSQWVTSVGATRFIGQKVGNAEMASDQFGSGGGFSKMFPAFKDQVEAVNHYFQVAKDLPPKGSYPAGGRGTPDLSALGEGYQVLANGQLQAVGGTSASTPAFAAMVSLINEARLKAGKKQMGYLNPFLYQNADAFTDVTVGTNAIGRGTGPTKYGFECAKGWDPATGLGTPIFPKLVTAALAAGHRESTIVV